MTKTEKILKQNETQIATKKPVFLIESGILAEEDAKVGEWLDSLEADERARLAEAIEARQAEWAR